MQTDLDFATKLSRRQLLQRAGGGFGGLALAGLLQRAGLLDAQAASTLNPLAAKPSLFPTRAKSVIWLFMNGGPSHVDTWDYKPGLAKMDGKALEGFDSK